MPQTSILFRVGLKHKKSHVPSLCAYFIIWRMFVKNQNILSQASGSNTKLRLNISDFMKTVEFLFQFLL